MPTISKDKKLLTLINVFTVEPAKQQQLVALLTHATESSVRHVTGFISASLHRSLDGTRVVMYAQWRSVEDYDAMRNNPSASLYMQQAVAHCVVVLDTAPLRVHYDSGAVETAVQAGRDEACDMTHGRLGSMDEQRNELLLLRGLDREDVDQGKKLVVFRDRGHGQLSGGNGWWTSGGSEELG